MAKDKVIEVLNKALTEELTALLQYMQHHYLYQGANSPSVRDLLKKVSMTEMKHAYVLGERVAALGGMPTTKPEPIKVPKKSIDMIKADLEDEIKAVEDYKKWIKEVSEDPVSRLMLEKILGDEEEHVTDLQALLGS
ncbi:MAG TPA: ferritin-like domain-containing protein [Candidatus Hypogeohydataceae bacterium YC38]